MLRALENVIRNAEEAEGGVGISELRSPEPEDDREEELRSDRKTVVLGEIRSILDQMWWSESSFLIRAAEVLADGSRERKDSLRVSLLFGTS
jgi:hypothetical protein